MCVRADDSCDGIASDVGLKVDVLERNNAGDGYEDIPAYMLFKFGTTKARRFSHSRPNAKMTLIAILCVRLSWSFQTTKCGQDQMTASSTKPKVAMKIVKGFREKQ